MEDKILILQAIEELDKSIDSLRNDFNQKLNTLSSQIEENTQLLKRLLELKQNQIQDQTSVVPGMRFSRAKHIYSLNVKKGKFKRRDNPELISYIGQEAVRNKYDPDSDPVLKDFRRKLGLPHPKR